VSRGLREGAGIFKLERHRAKASRTGSPESPFTSAARPSVRGKSIFLNDEKLYVRGVTYGTFRPDEETDDFPPLEAVAEDFAAMARNDVNAVRTYTVPPRWLLDLAHEHGLYVLVGLPWEQHVTFLAEPARVRSIKERIREGIRACAGHPAVLCYAIGNEIPASIVRWHGRHRIERFLEQLYLAAKEEDPDALVTYVNYPSTEYLHLPFVDLVCFNVFLEAGAQFESYLARLQNIAGDRPLILTETGLDSLRNSEKAQARALDWQVRTAFGAGCAGTFVFAWTDEWYRGGFDIDDWAFGLVNRRREPKQALAAVGKAFAETPFPADPSWPRVSVVVCTYNDERTLPGCFDGLRDLEYPDYEVIVVNDGSTDATDAITLEYGFRLISTENRGLASARNAGLHAATGEIVAYIDADARPDSHWLSHLVVSFLKSSHVGIGGPNIPPSGDGAMAECVANAPGGPIHVLLSDQLAEHIPGCNMAFWKKSLEAIGGFDPQFWVAGDDVDICWRLQEKGWTVGFSPGAVVWHHRRSSIHGYVKQQFEYGKAEALLERKWPERYNRAGHLAWAGRVYGNGASKARGWRRWKIYYGTWGSGLFQSVYQRTPGLLGALPLMPEWYLVIAALALVSAMGLLWTPLLFALPLCLLAGGALIFEAALGGKHASFGRRRRRMSRARMRLVTTFLYILQPAARLAGRIRFGLAPWRRRSAPLLALPMPRTRSVWCERWQSPDARLRRVESDLRKLNRLVFCGGDFERWDLQVRGGALGAARMRMAVEEHGSGKQFLRFRIWPRWSRVGLALTLVFAALAAGATLETSWAVAAILGATGLLLVGIMVQDSATATGTLMRAIEGHVDEAEPVTEPSLNGARPTPPQTASRPALNGSRADGEQNLPATAGALGELPSPAAGGIAFQSPINMREHGLNISDREE
jgi:glycosyltransferase involved in cell wall biosynthesis